MRDEAADEREHAWTRVHDAVTLMPGWAVGPSQYHADGDRWHVAAIHVAVRGRQAKQEAVAATGPTEIAALDQMAALLEAR